MKIIINAFLLIFIYTSCRIKKNEFYSHKKIEVYRLLNQGEKTYFIFTPIEESSLTWPEDVLYQYNHDSTNVKLLIRIHDAMSEIKPKTNSNLGLRIVREYPNLNLRYRDKKDSLRKSLFYVILLPNSIKKVTLP